MIDLARMNNCKIHHLLFQLRITLELIPVQDWFDLLIGDHQKHDPFYIAFFVKGEIFLLECKYLGHLLDHCEDGFVYVNYEFVG